MATTTKVITANDINQGSSVVGVNASGAYDSSTTITKTASTLSVQYSARDYSAKFDDYGLRRKTVEIGDWNMDSTASGAVAHSLTNNLWKNVRSIEVAVRNDDDDTYYTDSTDTSANADAGIEIEKIDSANVTLKRAGSGTFDATAFNATSYNRGWVTIWYE